jgi:hypothetical protein
MAVSIYPEWLQVSTGIMLTLINTTPVHEDCYIIIEVIKERRM